MEIAIRTGREKGMAHATIGVAIATSSSAMTATDAMAIAPARGSDSSGTRRLHEAPRPVPSSSENSVTVSEYTGCPSSSTKRCSTDTSISMKPAPSAAKYTSHATQPRGGVAMSRDFGRREWRLLQQKRRHAVVAHDREL